MLFALKAAARESALPKSLLEDAVNAYRAALCYVSLCFVGSNIRKKKSSGSLSQESRYQ